MATPRSLVELGLEFRTDLDVLNELMAEANSLVAPDDIADKLITPTALEEREPPVWLMERFIPEDGMVVMYGPPKKGKTFIAMEWAFHMAQGLPWHGYHMAMPMRVLYLAAEGLGSLGERQKALRQERGWDDDLAGMRWVTGSRHLSRASMGQSMAELVHHLNAYKPHVAFVDTLMRHTPGADIASNADMGVVVDWLDKFRQAFGTTFVLIHHTRKNDSEFMGAQHIYGSTDVMVRVKPTDRDTIELWVESREWDDHSPPFELRIKSVEPKPGWAVVEKTDPGLSGMEGDVLTLVTTKPGILTRDVQETLWPEKPKGDHARQQLVALREKGYIAEAGNPAQWYPFNMAPNKEDE